MAGAPASLNTLCREAAPFQGNPKRPGRDRPLHAPIKKRVMAQMNLKRKPLEQPAHFRTPKIKKERLEEEEGEDERKKDAQRVEREAGVRRWSEEEEDYDCSGRQYPAPPGGGALDLSPGLKHTLAQFTLSSQSSLGGPAAFSARRAPDLVAPPPSPPVLGGGPLLVPCDSSTELTHSALEGESITSFVVGGVRRLCLPQVLNSVLRQFSLQQINGVCDELYVYCSRCDGQQLHVLKVLGVLPFNVPSCGLITLTDAQRLCNALLRPGAAHPGGVGGGAGPGGKGGGARLREGGTNFRVEHQCLGKCQGVFAAALYAHPDAPCIQCVQCHLLFAPPRFVMHSHRSPDKRTCHWGFDSARWARYLHLGRKHLGTPREAELRQLLQEVKEKFRCPSRRTPPDKKDDAEEKAVQKVSDVCSHDDKLCESAPEQKVKPHPALILKPRLYPDIKEESGHPTSVHHRSCLLYMYDKMRTPGMSEAPPLGKEGAGLSEEVLEVLCKQHCSGAQRRGRFQEPEDTAVMSSPAPTGELKQAPWLAAMETAPSQDSCSKLLREEDKDSMVLEVLHMYCRQQELLQSTLHKHRQLEMELEAMRRGAAAVPGELQKEPQEVQTEHAQENKEGEDTEHAQRRGEEGTEHAQRRGEEGTEHAQRRGEEEGTEHAQRRGEEEGTEHAQRRGEEGTEHAQRRGEEDTEHAQRRGEEGTEHAQNKGVEHTGDVQGDVEGRTEHAQNQNAAVGNPRPQMCTCKQNMEQGQEAHYASQLQELQRRLDQAEEDRAQLQEELRREREAREMLELRISQLRQQMSQCGDSEPCASPALQEQPCASPAPKEEPCTSPAPQEEPCASPAPKEEPCASPAPQEEPCASPARKEEPCAIPTPQEEPCASPASQEEPCASPAPQEEPCASPAPQD